MTFAELDIVPRTKGRAAKAATAVFVRDLTPSDLALLASERAVQPPLIKRLRERHHALARCLALGMTDTEALAVTGYDHSRLSILRNDPTFQGLVADYKSLGDARLGDFVDRTVTLSLTAVENLQEMLENEEAPLPASMQLEIAKFAADRTGHAPIQKSVALNANVDLGNKLQAARKRLAQISEIKVVSSESGDSDRTGTDGG